MTDKIREQILAIRDSGRTNMFDVNMVQRIAYESGFYELACYIEGHDCMEYVHFILRSRNKAKKDHKALAMWSMS